MALPELKAISLGPIWSHLNIIYRFTVFSKVLEEVVP
jgi:hypothetical protein